LAIIIKTTEQINGIRASSQLAAGTLTFLEPFIQPGISTEKLNILAEQYIRDHGAIPAPLNYKGFPKSICTSLNEVICHGIPSEHEILKDGDIINIDVTTILNGYFGDTSRTFAVGEISSIAKKLLNVTYECLDLGIEQVKPENCFGNIGYAISKHAHRNKFSVVHQFVGHGVGLEFHEEPNVHHIANKNTGLTMKSGMIFTIEPMICQGDSDAIICEIDGWTARTSDNLLSAQFEHTVLVTDDGYEVLTK